MNQIGSIQFNFTMQSEDFAHNLYGRWDSFFANCVECVADETLNQMKNEKLNEDLIIDLLELDLGTILEDELDEQFPIRFREKLEEALGQLTIDNGQLKQRSALANFDFSILKFLCDFLLTGHLPWTIRQKYKNISQLFWEVLKTHSSEFKHFLQTYGHYSSLQERFVYQLNDLELDEGVRLLAPGESTFILSYVKLLHRKYKQFEKPTLRETDHHIAVWQVVYSYLLTNRSSYFNKKSFLTQTITQLAATYNTTYHTLLEAITHELNQFAQTHQILPELFQLLGDLKTEFDQHQFQASAYSAVKLYKDLSLYLQGEIKKGISEVSLQTIINMLSSPDTCRQFLQLLTEDEIIALVHLVIPEESQFVIAYAESLGQLKIENSKLKIQKKKLESTASNFHFSILTFQFIFVVLLENRGVAFNRIHFVSGVLKKIASHYNLSYLELLQYFVGGSALAGIGHDLLQILQTLYKKEQKQSPPFIDKPEESISFYIKRLSQKENLIQEDRETLWTLLASHNTRNTLLYKLQEEGHRQLVQVLLKQESPFILSYTAHLDKHQQRGILEGKAGSEFRQLKWIFVWTVLTEIRQTALNQKYFAAGVLKAMAAHYNLTYIDLLTYFYQTTESYRSNAELRTVLETLYQEEMKRVVDLVLQTGQQEAVFQLLQVFYSHQSRIVWNITVWLNETLCRQLLPAASQNEFRTFVWKVLFRLLEKQTVTSTFSYKEFIMDILKQIAGQYHLSHRQLFTSKIWTSLPATLLPETQHYIKEIYQQQSNSKKPEQQAEKPTVKTPENKLPDSSLSIEEEMKDPIYINNAGMVLLSPYLPRLFEKIENSKLKIENEENDLSIFNSPFSIKTTFLFVLQYLVFGRTDFPEYELTLNKLLVNFEPGKPIPQSLELTDYEKETADGMLKAVLQHWEKLKNTSIEGLREAFLQREGKLEDKDDHYLLVVEEKAYDILLDSLPWNFRTIKYSWMEKPIQVRWR